MQADRIATGALGLGSWQHVGPLLAQALQEVPCMLRRLLIRHCLAQPQAARPPHTRWSAAPVCSQGAWLTGWFADSPPSVIQGRITYFGRPLPQQRVQLVLQVSGVCVAVGFMPTAALSFAQAWCIVLETQGLGCL